MDLNLTDGDWEQLKKTREAYIEAKRKYQAQKALPKAKPETGLSDDVLNALPPQNIVLDEERIRAGREWSVLANQVVGAEEYR